MKDYAIIPIFIPHLGCPNDCVFCNQRRITAKPSPVTPGDVEQQIKMILPQLEKQSVKNKEIAFFGGSFTAIPRKLQEEYLSIAKKYKDGGLVHRIRLSTRPDCIDESILNHLKNYGVDIIELGVQSFDDEVLLLANRGHDTAVVYDACELIKGYGFILGIQLMIGLPHDTKGKAVFSAMEATRLQPEFVRIYPTVVIDDTALMDMYKRGEYTPFLPDEEIEIAAEMCKIFYNANINVIRIGLKSSSILNSGDEITKKTFHPAFRQLVEGRIAREELIEAINKFIKINDAKCITISANSRHFANIVGHKAENKKYLTAEYPFLDIKYKVNNSLKDRDFNIESNCVKAGGTNNESRNNSNRK